MRSNPNTSSAVATVATPLLPAKQEEKTTSWLGRRVQVITRNPGKTLLVAAAVAAFVACFIFPPVGWAVAGVGLAAMIGGSICFALSGAAFVGACVRGVQCYRRNQNNLVSHSSDPVEKLQSSGESEILEEKRNRYETKVRSSIEELSKCSNHPLDPEPDSKKLEDQFNRDVGGNFKIIHIVNQEGRVISFKDSATLKKTLEVDQKDGVTSFTDSATLKKILGDVFKEERIKDAKMLLTQTLQAAFTSLFEKSGLYGGMEDEMGNDKILTVVNQYKILIQDKKNSIDCVWSYAGALKDLTEEWHPAFTCDVAMTQELEGKEGASLALKNVIFASHNQWYKDKGDFRSAVFVSPAMDPAKRHAILSGAVVGKLEEESNAKKILGTQGDDGRDVSSSSAEAALVGLRQEEDRE